LSIETSRQVKSYNIYNTLGQLLQFSEINNNQIDVSKLHQGMLLINLYTKDQQTFSTNVIKN